MFPSLVSVRTWGGRTLAVQIDDVSIVVDLDRSPVRTAGGSLVNALSGPAFASAV